MLAIINDTWQILGTLVVIILSSGVITASIIRLIDGIWFSVLQVAPKRDNDV